MADFSRQLNLHMEPEMCVLFNVNYKGQQVESLEAVAYSAFNDCSIRRPNAKKISEKKNWGLSCTGISGQWYEIDQFRTPGILDYINIASYLQRDGQLIQYGIDSPVSGYQYFYSKLLNWIVNTLNQQQDVGPLENLHQYMLDHQLPEQIIISLGATRYTSFGETGFLKPSDRVGIFVYDSRKTTSVELERFFSSQLPADSFEVGSALIQTIRQN